MCITSDVFRVASLCETHRLCRRYFFNHAKGIVVNYFENDRFNYDYQRKN